MISGEIIFLLVILGLFALAIMAIFAKILNLVYKRVNSYLLTFASLLSSRVENSVFATRRSIGGYYQNRKTIVHANYLERFPELEIAMMVQTVPSKKQSFLPFYKKPTKNTFLAGKKVYCRIGFQEILSLTDPSKREIEIKKSLDELLSAVRVVELGEDFYK